MNEIIIKLANPMLRDKLNTLSQEYDVSAEILVNLAVKRLIDDIETIRDLRVGKVNLE